MKLAVVGKGGAGKTVLSTLLARAVGGCGFMVLAVDLDNNPGLAVSLGIPSSDTPLPDEAVEPRPGTAYGWTLASHLTPAEAVRRYATPAADKIVFLGFGNNAALDTPVTRYLTAVRQVVAEFDEPGWVVVADLAAGATNLFEGYARFASLALVAVEAMPASIVTAQSLLAILREDGTPAEVVVTKARGPQDVDRVARDLGTPFASIPFDPEVAHLEKRGSLVELSDESPALLAVKELVTRVGL